MTEYFTTAEPLDVTGDYAATHAKIAKYVAEVPFNVEIIERSTLEERASKNAPKQFASVEQACVNYLRHCATDYMEVIRTLNCAGELFSNKFERHVLHLERRSCVVTIKKRILDEIADKYPWLKAECDRQIRRDGLEDDPGAYEMPFGPFKSRPLREIDTSYLIYLLGLACVQKSLRSRIEGELASRQVSMAQS